TVPLDRIRGIKPRRLPPRRESRSRLPTAAAIDNETLDHLLSDVDDAANIDRRQRIGSARSASERADREIAQPEIREPALLPQPEQRPVEGLAHEVVVAADGDTDAFAEEAALGVGAPRKTQQLAESVPLSQKASEIPSPNRRST